VEVEEPIETNPQPDMLDWAVGIAQILAVLAAVLGAIWVYRQVVDARKAAKVERSLAYLGRYAEREFRQRVAAVTAYLRVTGARQCVAHIQAWETAPHAEADCLPRARPDGSAPHARKNDVYEVLDFFEELSGAFNGRHLDRDVLLRTLGSVPAQFLQMTWWFITWRRRGESLPETRLYAELETMVRTLRDDEEKRFKRLKPHPQIRVLAVTRRGAAPGEWERCGRLAAVLDRQLARGDPHFLEQLPDAAVPANQADSSLTLIAVPLDLEDPGHAERKKLVSEVERRLAHLGPDGLEAAIGQLGGEPPPRPSPPPGHPGALQRALDAVRKWLDPSQNPS
jgi:hypothetical protein